MQCMSVTLGDVNGCIRRLVSSIEFGNLQWINSFLCASYFIDMIWFRVKEHSVPV